MGVGPEQKADLEANPLGQPGAFESGSAGPDITLSWHDIKYTVPSSSMAQFGGNEETKLEQDSGKEDRVVLNSVSGSCASGSLTAILGPSGSGKTSLLNVLSGMTPVTDGATLTGQVRINGNPVSESVAGAVGYVAQDDYMFALSTVFETLMFTCQLKLPHKTEEERRAQIEQVIAELALGPARDTAIGGEVNAGGPPIRGISGGERKRVSVGLQLLTSPKLLFLDEPTSGVDDANPLLTLTLAVARTLTLILVLNLTMVGLDSFQALNLISHLVSSSKAEGGRVFVAALHQPRSAIYEQLDTLVLLANGNLAYHGTRQDANGFFAGATVHSRCTNECVGCRYRQPCPNSLQPC